MSMRFTTKARRSVVALTVAAGLALGATGCGGGGDDKKPEASAPASSGKSGSEPNPQQGTDDPPIAEMKGTSGLMLQITTASRDSGGFVTVNGILKNDGGERITVPAAVRGDETEVLRHGMSLGGATLVDSQAKKRYYVLRDTDGRPLTTTGFTSLKAGETLAVFMQFPAPPEATKEVTFQLPTFASAPLQITG
ncbi:hypothetical protein [Streptomyces acidiscabies]|uniref:Secreted protein n=1 Tax=Streptomyces acidiscabies TaxID=42234 RepID=A0A0L0K2C7_9ACTN|nr:hypothetical protein [Streptomyces acidiscabies]KND31929.1 hypothetical protein IQ63_24305 [Streptomyces acidiscabies]